MAKLKQVLVDLMALISWLDTGPQNIQETATPLTHGLQCPFVSMAAGVVMFCLPEQCSICTLLHILHTDSLLMHVAK